MHRRNPASHYRSKPQSYSKNNSHKPKERTVDLSPKTFTYFASGNCSNVALILMFLTLSAGMIAVNAQMAEINVQMNSNHAGNFQSRTSLSVSVAPKAQGKSNNSTVQINHKIAQICRTMPFLNANKAPGIVYGSQNGNLMPEVCATPRPHNEKNASDCAEQISQATVTLPQAYKNQTAVSVTYDKVKDNYKIAKAELFTKANVIFAKLKTKAQQVKFEKRVHFLGHMLLRKESKALFTKLGVGVCDIHAHSNQYDIIVASSLAGEKVKVQQVQVIRQKPGNDIPQTLFNGHAYTLVDSNMSDVNITNDKAAAENYLRQITQGFICDSWNEGFFKRSVNNINELYRSNWDSVIVQTISAPDDNGYADLPKEAVDFLDQYSVKLGLKEQEKNVGLKLKK